jgi:PhnB protein
MDKAFKPNGYNSVSPYFVINGAQKLVDLLKELFNASEKRRYDLPNGKIMHIELQIDDSIIMIGDASEQFPAHTHLMHIYVKNVDETFNKAIRLGCESIYSPKAREGDPNKRGAFKDFAGNIWTVATQL